MYRNEAGLQRNKTRTFSEGIYGYGSVSGGGVTIYACLCPLCAYVYVHAHPHAYVCILQGSPLGLQLCCGSQQRRAAMRSLQKRVEDRGGL